MNLQYRGRQQGGTLLGLIIGLLLGFAISLAVALYVTKVPVPFMNKVPQRTPEQDAAEAARNKNWDPNSGLYGKNPARPASGVPAAGSSSPYGPILPSAPPTAGSTGTSGGSAAPGPILPSPATAGAAPRSTRDPAAILADRPAPTPAPTIASARPAAPSGSNDPFLYFVQAGAYSRSEEAEQQRARLAMLGFGAKITEREQAGRTVYRVRVGPFEKKDDADQTKSKIETAGVESALVRVQK